ncbi:unnamed protein product [Rotaria socialis]|uniref:Uncharacterized protein n=1 Tax=Rotaria socialis TaxID=392032 RepID=A0A817TYM0_9BILA|nr:unnamed protein product [Rotaria socialis]CAF3324010.1 unnamed protein product [Rotaria socialis]CAF4409337.1 unnamed protein product [Rotaria socialis]CAF4495682.1 unnamed protein product [Rotaria socialis]
MWSNGRVRPKLIDPGIAPEPNTTIYQLNLKFYNAKLREDKSKLEEELNNIRQDNIKFQNDFIKFQEDIPRSAIIHTSYTVVNDDRFCLRKRHGDMRS